MVSPCFLSWELCNPGTSKWSLKNDQETNLTPSELIRQPCPAPAGQSARAGSCGCLRQTQPGTSAGTLAEHAVSFSIVDRSVGIWLGHGNGHFSLTTERICVGSRKKNLLHFWGGQVCFNAFAEVPSRLWLVFQLPQPCTCVWNPSTSSRAV